jgi:hypothetical protein
MVARFFSKEDAEFYVAVRNHVRMHSSGSTVEITYDVVDLRNE